MIMSKELRRRIVHKIVHYLVEDGMERTRALELACAILEFYISCKKKGLSTDEIKELIEQVYEDMGGEYGLGGDWWKHTA